MAFAALATVLLALALWSIVAQIALLTGAGAATNAFLVGLVPAVLAAGVGWGFYLKKRRPGTHAMIGGEDVRRAEAANSPAGGASSALASEPGDPTAPAEATA
jgi:hypothetical protein